MTTHQGSGGITVRTSGTAGTDEPVDKVDEDAPVITQCPVCGKDLPHAANRLDPAQMRFVDDPEDEVPGFYVCSETCADEIADRIDHHFPCPETCTEHVWIDEKTGEVIDRRGEVNPSVGTQFMRRA